jgi:hypothetical protein
MLSTIDCTPLNIGDCSDMYLTVFIIDEIYHGHLVNLESSMFMVSTSVSVSHWFLYINVTIFKNAICTEFYCVVVCIE